MGGDKSRALNAVTTVVTGALGGQTDLQVVANTLAPYAAQEIGKEWGHGEDQNKAAQLAAHAILGATLAYVNGGNPAAGGSAAAAAEAAADYLSKPYKDNPEYQNAKGEFEANRLPENVKTQIRDLTAAIGAVVGGSVGDSAFNAQIAGVVGQNAVENNDLNINGPFGKTNYQKFDDEMIACRAKSGNCASIIEKYWKEHEVNHARYISKCAGGGLACAKWEELLFAQYNDTSRIKDEGVRNLSRLMISADLLIVSKDISLSDKVLANIKPTDLALLVLAKKANPQFMTMATAKQTLKNAGIAASIGMTNEALFQKLANGTIDFKTVLAIGINVGISGAVLPVSQVNKPIAPNNTKLILGESRYLYFFGNAAPNAHNTPRSNQNKQQLASIGIHDNQQGRVIVENALRSSLANSLSVTGTFSKILVVKYRTLKIERV